MHAYLTDAHGAFQPSEARFHRSERAEMELVVCRPDRMYQRISGFGGAFTEAGAYVFAGMPEDVQDRFVQLCFGGAEGGSSASRGCSGDLASGGNAYTLCRTHIQSCDFALGNYAYVKPLDRKLKTFSLDRDRTLLLPFIQCGLAVNPTLEILASPWSPPAFMKTNRMMNAGGRLRRSCYAPWAALLARYVSAYAQEGVRIGRMSVQNEPMAAQVWDSCLFTAGEEADFAAHYLRPALDAAGHEDVRLCAWDHNTDRLLDRVEAVFGDSEANAAFGSVGFHWYAGDHFEQVRAVAEAYPDKELLFTEGCVEYSRDGVDAATQERKAERYGHALMGCFEAGACGFIDWNLLLDERGGPNHARNFCEAPLMYDRQAGELVVNRSFYYLGHFSRFIVPGSRRFLVSRFSDELECTGFLRPDGKRVVVAMNRCSRPVRFEVAERPAVARIEIAPHSIMTLVWEGAEFGS
ncbi:MAG: glycoside hydrolase family 30 beta sandwich domain-containing protein [Gordonibacter sp.]